jgi:hypothetical protein
MGIKNIFTCEIVDTILLVDPKTFEVLHVANNHCAASSPAQRALSRQDVVRALQDIVNRPAVVLTGQVADLLYVALAGHHYTSESPRRASTGLARAARGHIERMRRDEQWQIAWQVLQVWGPMIRPWLGVVKLVDGFEESGAPEYLWEVAL